ncbi:DUF2254 domain-containing protein [Halobacillus sp. Marseille-Q1614]|uniref:DUF2254 domain-containing protein n=1 Tax=Halobacillus sp. Marseille-Q1614 TaxID=2709134 RepID=UPI0020C37EF1|nr:DUF2254 domain-containing protein [Halobacillus sp. Marseille-Q1614]
MIDKLINSLPVHMRKYLQMSSRQRKYELQMTLWSLPLIYIGGTIIIVLITLFLDLQLNMSNYVHHWFSASGQATQTLVSTLIGGILTLSAFTLNSLLIVLTNFSAQFSPRMMFNFISDKTTQHLLGIFHASFIYVLFVFLFLTNNENEYYSAIPIMAVILAALTLITFIFFINHASSWMQVHNFTYSMKNTSKQIIEETLRFELEEYRGYQSGDLKSEYFASKKVASIPKSAYIQMIHFKDMIDEAQKDDVVIKLYKKIGDFSLKDNRLFAIWGPGAEKVSSDKYLKMIEFGHKKTEIQEMKMGISKLSEVAVKAIGASDPETALTTIHHIADLLLTINEDISFTPYLQDSEKQTRIIMEVEDFEYYLHKGFGKIRHHMENDYTMITELISVINMMAESMPEDKQDTLWEFASNTADHILDNFIYDIDRRYLLEQLHELALLTGHEKDFYLVEKKLMHH